jgi:hypothetical protein
LDHGTGITTTPYFTNIQSEDSDVCLIHNCEILEFSNYLRKLIKYLNIDTFITIKFGKRQVAEQ